MKYCCKTDVEVMPFAECHWVGQGDCAQNRCDESEITVATDPLGNNGLKQCLCMYWQLQYGRDDADITVGGRKKSLCCKPNANYPDDNQPTMCPGPLSCDSIRSNCEAEDGLGGEDDDENVSFIKRSIFEAVNEQDSLEYEVLERRGGTRETSILINKWLPHAVGLLSLTFKSAYYHSTTAMLKFQRRVGLPPLAFT